MNLPCLQTQRTKKPKYDRRLQTKTSQSHAQANKISRAFWRMNANQKAKRKRKGFALPSLLVCLLLPLRSLLSDSAFCSLLSQIRVHPRKSAAKCFSFKKSRDLIDRSHHNTIDTKFACSAVISYAVTVLPTAEKAVTIDFILPIPQSLPN
jgi:hypothetical protein